MRWVAAILLGALCAGCVGTGTEEETQPPEKVGTAFSDWLWWGPVPSGVVEDLGTTADELTYTPSAPERIEESADALFAPSVKVVCAIAGTLAAAGACRNEHFWQKHCPAGTKRHICDKWKPSSCVDADCDKLRELTCDLAGFGGGEFATFVCKTIGQ